MGFWQDFKNQRAEDKDNKRREKYISDYEEEQAEEDSERLKTARRQEAQAFGALSVEEKTELINKRLNHSWTLKAQAIRARNTPAGTTVTPEEIGRMIDNL